MKKTFDSEPAIMILIIILSLAIGLHIGVHDEIYDSHYERMKSKEEREKFLKSMDNDMDLWQEGLRLERELGLHIPFMLPSPEESDTDSRLTIPTPKVICQEYWLKSGLIVKCRGAFRTENFKTITIKEGPEVPENLWQGLKNSGWYLDINGNKEYVVNGNFVTFDVVGFNSERLPPYIGEEK